MKSVRMNGKYFLPPLADIVAHHAGDEFVAQLGDRLQAARHQRALAHAPHEHRRRQDHGDDHPGRGIRERGVDAKEIELEQPLDLELLHRAMHLAYLVPTSIPRLAASGQATLPVVSPGRIPRVRSNGAPGIVDAGDEAHERGPSPRNTAPNPTSGRANSRETPRPKGPRSYPPKLDRQRLSGGATLRCSAARSGSVLGLAAARGLGLRIHLLDALPGAFGVRIFHMDQPFSV